MALPLNFAPNLACLHDFFVLLYIPSIALAVGLAFEPIAARWSALAGVRAVAVVLAAIVILDLAPASRIVRASSEDQRQDVTARELGRTVGPDDLIVADPSICSFAPDRFSVANGKREQPPLPFYAGRICQTVLVAQTPDDAVRLAESPELGAGRNVFILNCGKAAWDLPGNFRDCHPESPIARYQLWRVSEVQTATNRVGPIR